MLIVNDTYKLKLHSKVINYAPRVVNYATRVHLQYKGHS
jgi:hypothetical protein